MHTRAMSRSTDAWEMCVQRTSNDSSLLDVLVRGARRRCESATGGSGDHPSKNWSEAVREVVTAAFNDDRVALLLREKMRSCSYGTHGRTEGQQVPSTTVPLVGETKTRAVAESPREEAQSAHGVTLSSKGKSDQDRPRCALGPKEKSTECDNTPGHARESRGSEFVPARGTKPLFSTDSAAQLTHRRGQKHPGERGTGYGIDTDDLALADVQLSPDLVGGGVGVGGVGGGGGSGDGDGGGGGEGGGSGREGGVGEALSVSGVCTLFTVKADIELGKNQEHEAPAPAPVMKHLSVSAGSQLDKCELGGDGTDLPKRRASATGETGENTARGSAGGCRSSPALLPPVRLLPSRCDPTGATAVTAVAATAAAAVVNSADIAEGIQDSTLLLGASALAFFPALSTEETLVEGAAGSEETEPIVPRPINSECQKEQRPMLDDVNKASTSPRAAVVGAFILVGDARTGSAQAATGVMDRSHVPCGTCPDQFGAGGAAVQPAQESRQTGGGAAHADGVRYCPTILRTPATPSKGVEEEGAVAFGASAAVSVGLGNAKAVLGGGLAGRSVALEREPLPDPTEEEDYAYDFESPKCVRFSDESLWSVHEVRASFERHELADLFYTVDELDRMSEEAEREEREEQSGCSILREDAVEADGGWVHLGGDTPARVIVDASESIEDISIESHSLDLDDSDDRF